MAFVHVTLKISGRLRCLFVIEFDQDIAGTGFKFNHDFLLVGDKMGQASLQPDSAVAPPTALGSASDAAGDP
jgi:hypothetical protein